MRFVKHGQKPEAKSQQLKAYSQTPKTLPQSVLSAATKVRKGVIGTKIDRIPN